MLANSKSKDSRTPRRVKDSMQELRDSNIQNLDAGNIQQYKTAKRRLRTTPQLCSCPALRWAAYWNFTANSQLSLSHYKRHTSDCPLYKSTNSYATTVCYHMHNTLFKDLVRLKLWATFGSGGLSLGMLTHTDRSVRRHHLERFFFDLYTQGAKADDNKTLDRLVKIAHRQLRTSFNSGLSTPNDVDEHGNNLLHVSGCCLCLICTTNN
jgi:hypothetical protein